MGLLRSARAIALAALLLLVFAGAASANTITVTTTLDDNGSCPADCSLRHAIASAGSGDTIQLSGSAGAPMIYAVTQGSPIAISQNLTIQGNGPAATRIDGSGNVDGSSLHERLFNVTAGNVSMNGVRIQNGTDGNEAGSTLTLHGGGGIFISGSANVTLGQVDFFADSAPVGGGISSATSGTLAMTDVNFKFNGQGGGFGGGLFVRSGTATLNNGAFENNSDFGGGGAVFLYGGTTSLTNTTVYSNGVASGRGGGIDNDNGTLHLLNDTFSGDLRGSIETDVGASTSAENTIVGQGFSDGGIDFACVAQGITGGAGTTAKAITTDNGNNLDEDGHCGLSGTGDKSGVSANLVPPGANGGNVDTMALLNGSAAIDAGNDTDCPTKDARGITRSGQGAHCDIGAFEAVLLGSPTATTDPPTIVEQYDGGLNGTFNLAGEAGGYHFIYGTSPGALNNVTQEESAGVLSSDTHFLYQLPGLSPGITYYYKAVADNASGSTIASGPPQQFTTLPDVPTITNVSTESVTDTTAKLDFTINPNGADTTYVIVYGPTTGYGQSTIAVDIGGTSGDQSLTTTLTGLTPNVVYHFDVQATNSVNMSDSGDNQFKTEEQVNGQVGQQVTFTDAGDFGYCPSATIDWGDGTTSNIPSSALNCTDDGFDGSKWTLSAPHVYSGPGRYKIHVDYGSGNTTDGFAVITPVPTPTTNPTPTATPTSTSTPTPTPPIPLPLSCSRASIVLLDVHVEGGKVVVGGLALPKYAGKPVSITSPNFKKAPGGKATVQTDGTFQTTLPLPPKRARSSIRYQATVSDPTSKALKLTRKLVITSEKSVSGGLQVNGILTGGKKQNDITVTQQLSCSQTKVFKKIKAGKGGKFSVTLPRPTGSDDLAFFRLDAKVLRGTTNSLPVAVRAAG